MAKKQVTHVRLKGDKMICNHCGQVYQMNLPAPLDVWLAACEAFLKKHKKCKPEGPRDLLVGPFMADALITTRESS